MDMQAALRARLVGQTGAASRVYWLDRPQGTDLPAITLQTISADRPRTHSGLQPLRLSRVQMDVWANSYAEGRTVFEAAVAAVVPTKLTANGIFFDSIYFEGEADLTERLETKLIYRTRVDLLVWHQPA
jgi:hypothetical protein